MVSGRLGDRSCEHACSEIHGKMPGGVARFFMAPARPASFDGDAWLGVLSGNVGRKV